MAWGVEEGGGGVTDVGFVPPMLREIVEGRRGAGCCGGAGRGTCWMLRLNLPGTNSEAPALRLLAMVEGRRAAFGDQITCSRPPCRLPTPNATLPSSRPLMTTTLSPATR